MPLSLVCLIKVCVVVVKNFQGTFIGLFFQVLWEECSWIRAGARRCALLAHRNATLHLQYRRQRGPHGELSLPRWNTVSRQINDSECNKPLCPFVEWNNGLQDFVQSARKCFRQEKNEENIRDFIKINQKVLECMQIAWTQSNADKLLNQCLS